MKCLFVKRRDSFIESACSASRQSLGLVFFDVCMEAVHTWPGKEEDGPDNHSVIDIGTFGAAAVASKSDTCLCGRRNRRRPSDMNPHCTFCKLLFVPTRQLVCSVVVLAWWVVLIRALLLCCVL